MLWHDAEYIELAQKVAARLEQGAVSGLILDKPVPFEHVAIDNDFGRIIRVDLSARRDVDRAALAFEFIQRLSCQGAIVPILSRCNTSRRLTRLLVPRYVCRDAGPVIRIRFEPHGEIVQLRFTPVPETVRLAAKISQLCPQVPEVASILRVGLKQIETAKRVRRGEGRRRGYPFLNEIDHAALGIGRILDSSSP